MAPPVGAGGAVGGREADERRNAFGSVVDFATKHKKNVIRHRDLRNTRSRGARPVVAYYPGSRRLRVPRGQKTCPSPRILSILNVLMSSNDSVTPGLLRAPKRPQPSPPTASAEHVLTPTETQRETFITNVKRRCLLTQHLTEVKRHALTTQLCAPLVVNEITNICVSMTRSVRCCGL